MRRFILFLSFILGASIANGANSADICGEVRSPVTYKYCYTSKDLSSSHAVLFYLHGGGGDEHEWRQISAEISAYWSSRGITPPLVVSVSFGPYWLLVAKNGAPQSGLFEIFQEQVIPQMEKLALGKSAQQRWLMGLSMGGFNATQVLGNFPAGSFQRALFVCPAIVDLSPWAKESEISAYAQAHQADLSTLHSIAKIAQPFVPDDRAWNTVVSPFVLIDSVSASSSQIFVATNKDDMTFGYGGNLLAQKLLSKNGEVRHEIWSGGHCQLDSESVAKFFRP